MAQATGRKALLIFMAMVLLSVGLTLSPAAAESISPAATEGPVGLSFAVKSAARLPVYKAAPIDVAQAQLEARDLDAMGEAPTFALPEATRLTPGTDGVWEDLDARFQVWRTRISAPGALSLNFGFDDFRLPKGARLSIYPADLQDLDDPRGYRVFTANDNKPHGQMWTPVVLADEVILELIMPRESRGDYKLELTSVNRGFRYLGEPADKDQGTCNIDVICPEGDPWRDEINSVGVYTVNGVWFCTGAMINNTAQDGRPYFLTANHCGMSSSNDQGIVVYWDFQSVNCGDLSGGDLSRYQSGSTFLAAAAGSDFCLLELDDYPAVEHHVTYSGWDHRDITSYSSAVTIHHPDTQEMAISFEDDPTTTTSYLQTPVPGDASHIRIIDWDLGTTEPGSSGSPLYDANHRIIGQLHGGYAACGNNESDWYGRLFVSFPQIAAWLDPLGSGAQVLDLYDPQATGIQVLPGTGFTAAGPQGGPFSPTSEIYTVNNNESTPVSINVTTGASWLSITGGTGAIPGGGSTPVTVELNSMASTLPNGSYGAVVSFLNTTDGGGDTTRLITLNIGAPELVHSVNMDANPNWSMPNLWDFGVPQGGGGNYGNVDPTAGYTGSNVIGYNLAGDYQANLDEVHMTSTSFDCSNLGAVNLKFWRYLNVEDPEYDHAAIYVSNNGVDFDLVWANDAEITDGAWTQMSYDISAVADHQETVYLRWTMGTTDGSWQFSGWNIDDVEIWGLVDGSTPGPDVPAYTLSVGNYPNPFNPLTRVEFTLEKAGHAQMEVFDLQGRLVRTLVSRTLTEGPHQVIWDGHTQDGRRAGSGVYFARLRSGGEVAEHKMVLLK